MQTRSAALLLSAFVVCRPAIWEPARAQSVTHLATQIKGGDFAVEPDHTIVIFALSHMGFSNYSGRLSKVSGTLALDPHNPAAAHVSISVPTTTISTTSPALDRALTGSGWLDSATYPTATFVSQDVRPIGANDAWIDGILTLHGVSKPLTLHAIFNGAGIDPIDGAYTVGFDLTGTIHRSDFGVTKYATMVGDEITLTIEAAFERR